MLANHPNFTSAIRRLEEISTRVRNSGSVETIECLTDTPKLTKHNFFNDKFDTTAWNDYSRNPRFADDRTDDPCTRTTSRHTLVQQRTIKLRDMCQQKLDIAESKRPQFSTGRIALITDWTFENG